VTDDELERRNRRNKQLKWEDYEWVREKLIMLFIPSLPASVPSWAVTTGLVVSVSVGLIFGVLPARKASRLDPIECLRYE
jgi:ABC-type antimicrobial peptide transport system permease subunit